MYMVKTPWWLRALYPSLTWRISTTEKLIYLTFDDGPNATATPFVLEQLRQYNAKASFFCIGRNVAEQPGIYADILQDGHSTGNHTYTHVNGWKVSDEVYLREIGETSRQVRSNLFRPPYGRISHSQVRKINNIYPGSQIIMWDVLSGDFDQGLSPGACLGNVLRHTGPGSIVVFHDSAKAMERLQFTLPAMLEHFTNAGYVFRSIPVNLAA